MGANDAAEMLEAAKAECVRLERIIADAIDVATDSTYVHPEDRLFGMVRILERARGESGGTTKDSDSITTEVRDLLGNPIRFVDEPHACSPPVSILRFPRARIGSGA